MEMIFSCELYANGLNVDATLTASVRNRHCPDFSGRHSASYSN